MVWLDFGRVFPAVLFAQEINGRINVQHEMLGFNEGATIFAPKVKRFWNSIMPTATSAALAIRKAATRARRPSRARMTFSSTTACR